MQQCFMRYKDHFSDVELYELWDRLCDSGTAQTTFFGGQAVDHQSFRDLVRRDCNHLFVVFYEGKAGAIVWLNDMRERSAHIHFSVFRPFWGRKRDKLSPSIKMGRYVTASLVRNYDLDVLVGQTPLRNKLACRYIGLIGARPVGVLPKAAWFADTGKSEDVLLTAVTRESTEDSWTEY